MRAIHAAHVEDTDYSRPSERFPNYVAHETQALHIAPNIFDLAGEIFCHGFILQMLDAAISRTSFGTHKCAVKISAADCDGSGGKSTPSPERRSAHSSPSN